MDVESLPAASATVFVATFAAIAVAIVVLLLVDEWLARLDRDESRAHAANLYADGQRLLAAQRPHDASDRLASAVAIDRTNVVYQLGLAEASLADGRPADAETTLKAVLDRSETDGAANLLMARVLVREGRVDDAKSFYHRSVYGQWHGDSAGQRMRTRFELIDLLARHGTRQELLAELLPLEEVAPDSIGLRRKLGRLFIDAGSPARGVAILEQVLRRSPNDAAAYAGLGEAALVLGNYQTARADLAIAARLAPGDRVAAQQLALADTALALDPLRRGIGRRARLERARTLLNRSLDVHTACVPAMATTAAPPYTDGAADSARRALARPIAPSDGERRADGMLSLATALWNSVPVACRPTRTVTDRAVALIHAKLAT
jgi:predicted Zn-dependent protease